MFYLEKKSWFGSKHPIVSEQFPFVTETSQSVASSFPKQKINPVVLLFIQPNFTYFIYRYFD